MIVFGGNIGFCVREEHLDFINNFRCTHVDPLHSGTKFLLAVALYNFQTKNNFLAILVVSILRLAQKLSKSTTLLW